MRETLRSSTCLIRERPCACRARRTGNERPNPPDPQNRDGADQDWVDRVRAGDFLLFGLSPVGEATYFCCAKEHAMRSRVVMATVVATALACLAATLHAQDQGQKGQRGQRGQGGQPGGRGTGGFGGFGGGFGGFGGFGGRGGTSRLQLLNVEAVQKELELVDEQLTAIQKVRDELRPMGFGGRGGAPGGDAGGRRRGGNGGNNPPPNGASLQSADLYFVQAQQPPGQGGQGGQGRRGGGQGGAGGFGNFQLTDEQRAEFEKQRLERLKQEKDKLAEILLPHQMKRLNEIYIQQLGT